MAIVLRGNKGSKLTHAELDGNFSQLGVDIGLVAGRVTTLENTASATIPTNLSQLNNDVGFITSETDSQTLSIVGNDLTISNGNTVTLPIPTIPTIPTNLSQFTNDVGFITSETDSQTLSILGNDLTISNGNTVTLPIPTIPTNISAFTNDAGYLTSETDQTLSILGNDLTISNGNTVTLPTPVTGTENYTLFATSTSSQPGTSVADGGYFTNEGNTTQIAVSTSVTAGFTRALITLSTSVVNVTNPAVESQVALERTVNGLNPTVVKRFIFALDNYGAQHVTFVDTHGASPGDVIEYKLKNDMSNYSSEDLRLWFGISGDTFGLREVA